MKKLFYILTLAATASLMFSCQKEKPQHEPGPADVAGCYGVYFPSQEASGSHVYNPTQEPVIEIQVSRTNSSGSITVPVSTSFSEEGIFEVEPIVFADGQKETTVKVRFDKAGEGTTYKASLMLEDPQYVSNYNANPIALDFSIMRVEMKYFTNPAGEKAKVHWVQGWWGEEVDTYLKYYELNGRRYYFTETIKESHYLPSKDQYYTEGGFWGTGDAFEWTFIQYPEKNDDGNPFIRIPKTNTGYHHSTYDADVYALDYFFYTQDSDDDDKFLTYAAANSGQISYYDGMGGFYFCIRSYYMFGVGGWNPGEYDTYGIAEGFTRTDFTLKGIEAGYTAEGKLPVAVYAGADTKKVDLAVGAGELTATQIANLAAAIVAGTAENVQHLTDFQPAVYKEKEVAAAATELTLPETGVYTLVAVSYGADGKTAVSEGSKLVNYVAAGDEEKMAVDLTCGVNSAAKYAGKGVNPESALEIWAYGKGIVDAKMAAVKYIDLAADMEKALAAVKETKSLPDTVIAAINGDGYVAVAEKLLPGTEYYTVVWASNGYEEDFFISEASCFTEGDPLPIYQTFTLADYKEEFLAKDYKDYLGTWNYYGVNMTGTLGLREYLGKVTITKSETEDEPYEDEETGETFYEQFLLLDGLSAGAVKAAGAADKDTFEFSFDTGNNILYVNSYWAAGYESYDKAPYYFTQYASAAGTWYRATYYMAAIPVMDGYFAFVDVSGSGYEFNGWSFGNTSVYWKRIGEPLLVDPAKDDNGVAPKAVSAAVNQARQFVRESAKEVGTGVYTEKGRVREILRRYAQKQGAVKVYDSLTGMKEAVCPVKTVKVSLNNSAQLVAPSQKEARNNREAALTDMR